MLFGKNLLTQGICIGLVLLVGTDAFALALGGGAGMLKFGCYLAMLALVVLNAPTVARGALAVPALTALLTLCVVSLLWSIDESQTARRLLALLSASAFAVLIGRMLSLRGLVLYIAVLATATAVLSLIAVAVIPAARGAPPWDTTWRGVFNHKNGLGAACGIGAPFAFYAASVTRGWLRRALIGGGLLSLLLLVASESRTSQVLGLLALINLGFAMLCRRQPLIWATLTLAVLVGSAGVAAALIAIGWSDSIFEAMGRKPTISGRIPIWHLVWPWVEARIGLGYGYAAFWDPESMRVVAIARDPMLRFTPFYSHNGLVETLLAVGVVGALLMGIVLVSTFRGVLRVLASGVPAQDLIPMVVFLLSFLLLNVTESAILQRDDLVWMIFVMVAVRLGTLERALVGSRAGATR